MKLIDLKNFLNQLKEKGVEVPTGLRFALEDFQEVTRDTPVDGLKSCEYNHQVGNEVITVDIQGE